MRRNPCIIMLALAWASALAVGCRPDHAVKPISPYAAMASSRTASTGQPSNQAPLQNLKLTLPVGWTATYDKASRWRVEKHAPPDNLVLLIWSMPKEQTPMDLVHFSHRLQTSSALTEGKCFLDRRTEQGNFADGYYVVGKFILKRDRRVRVLGLAMIRNLGGNTLIFECLKIAAPEMTQEILDICKSARF